MRHKFIEDSDKFSFRGDSIKNFFLDLHSFEEDSPDSFTIGHNGERVGNDKTPFVKNPDYMCIGCSFTSGEALPERYSWPSIIRSFTNKTVNNCSMRGAGVGWLVNAAFDIMVKYGQPKQAYALMPDFERVIAFTYLKNEEKIETFHGYWNTELASFTHRWHDGPEKVVEIKDFKNRKYHIPAEMALLHSFFMLDTLVSHFRINTIPFSFSAWPSHTYESLRRLKNKYPEFKESQYWENYIDTSTEHRILWEIVDSMDNEQSRTMWRRFGFPDEPNCLCSHEPQTESQFNFWLIAADKLHPGLHSQIHFAEHFLGQPIGNDFLKEIP